VRFGYLIQPFLLPCGVVGQRGTPRAKLTAPQQNVDTIVPLHDHDHALPLNLISHIVLHVDVRDHDPTLLSVSAVTQIRRPHTIARRVKGDGDLGTHAETDHPQNLRLLLVLPAWPIRGVYPLPQAQAEVGVRAEVLRNVPERFIGYLLPLRLRIFLYQPSI